MSKVTIVYSETQEFSHELLKDAKAFSYAIKIFEDRGLMPVASEEFKDYSLFYFTKTNTKNDKIKTFEIISSFKSQSK